MRVHRTWPILAAAAALLIGAAWKVIIDGTQDTFAAALLAAGLVSLGAWLSIEVRAAFIARPSDD